MEKVASDPFFVQFGIKKVIIALSANPKRDGNKYGLIIITATTEAEMTWLYEFSLFMKYGFISSTSGLRNIVKDLYRTRELMTVLVSLTI